jgi:hypothetical protein
VPISRLAKANVRGLDDFRAKLRRHADAKQLERELRTANFSVAKLIEERSKPIMAGLRGGMGPRAADTIKASRSAVAARLGLGGSDDAPYALGVEFGAVRGIPRNGGNGRTIKGWNQFDGWRGNGDDAGYAVFPTIRDSTDEILDRYGDEIERILSDAFPD